MPSKNTKVNNKTEAEGTKQSKAKTTKKVEVDSEEEQETKPTVSKSKVTKKVEEDSEEEPETKQSASKAKSKKVEEDSEDDDEQETGSEEESDEEQEAGSKKTSKEKKKESFEELTSKLETLRTDMKTIDRETAELEKQLKTKEKSRNELERQVNNILKLLSKTHSDEVNKARKEKPKRRGNVNGGFNKEQPVPEVLVSFLGLEAGACMARPKVMSALNNKFTELKLKDGQTTTLDKTTAKALGLGKEGEGRVIKFTEFQSFLASFYPKKAKSQEIEA
jgi:hypothetical protein